MADDPTVYQPPESSDSFHARARARAAAREASATEGLPESDVPKWDGSAMLVVQDSLDVIARAAHGLGSGFNKGLANILGFPVDMVDAAAGLVGLGRKEGDVLMGGSEQYEQLLNSLNVSTSWDNADKVQMIAAKIGQYLADVAALAVPGSGLAKFVPGPSKTLPGQLLVEPFRQAPAQMAGAEVGGAVAAGGAGAVAEQVGIENEFARFGIETVAGIAAGALAMVRAVKEAAKRDAGATVGPRLTAAEVSVKDVYSPRMVAEVAQAHKADDFLRTRRILGDKFTEADESRMVEQFGAFLNAQDPKDWIWSKDAKGDILQSFKQRLARGDKPRPRDRSVTGADFEKHMEQSRKALKDSEKAGILNVLRGLRTGLLDRAANVRSALVNTKNKAGFRAQMYFDLALGSPAWAEHAMKGARRIIYSGLDEQGMADLGDMIANQRYTQVRAYRGGPTKLKRAQRDLKKGVKDRGPSEEAKGPFSLDQLKAARGNLRARVGEAKYKDLERRMAEYFDMMKAPLNDMREAGLISDTEFEKLGRFEYSPLEPLEYVRALDPPQVIVANKKKISISSSGIRPLGREQRTLINTDSELLLAHVIARTHSRIARNRANMELLKLARRRPNNGVVSLKRKRNWTQLSVMEKGADTKFYMKGDLADEWVTIPPTLESSAWKMLTAPADLVRLMATGISPEFAITNLPRDWFYAWLAPNQLFGKTYSSFMPLGFAQLARDLATVLPDVLTNGPRMQAYLKQGGGMAFLTQGARGETAITEGHSAWAAAKDILGIVNGRSELWTRLAIRERAIRNGMTQEEATWIARTQIDFSQGGSMVKVLDKFVPYLNAAMQGLRGTGRAAKQDPAGFAAKLIQGMGAVAGLWAYNRMNFPEGFAQVDERVQARNFIIMLPGHFIDKRTNQKRYNYIKIPVEHSFMAAKGVADAMMARSWGHFGEKTKRIPKQELIDAFQGSLSIFGDPGEALNFPMFKALLAMGNYDSWRADKVWKGMEGISPLEEVRESPHIPTPPMAVDFANAFAAGTGIELSPERLTAAWESFVPPNAYTLMATSMYNKATIGSFEPEGDDTRMIPKGMRDQRTVFRRKLVGVTHALGRSMELTNERLQALKGQDAALNRTADKMLARVFGQEGEASDDALDAYKDWTESDAVPPQHRDAIQERYIRQRDIRDAFGSRDTAGIPQMAWWINVLGEAPDNRASIIAWMEGELDPQAAQRFIDMAVRIPSLWTKDFKPLFKKARRERDAGGGP